MGYTVGMLDQTLPCPTDPIQIALRPRRQQFLALLRLADRGFAIEPKADALRGDPHIRVISSFEELLPLVPESLAPQAAS